MEKRILGKTGEKLSVVGFGGIVVMNESVESAKKIVA
ncbi:MAG: Aldo/keto reductase, partial [Thermotoga petrophila]